MTPPSGSATGEELPWSLMNPAGLVPVRGSTPRGAALVQFPGLLSAATVTAQPSASTSRIEVAQRGARFAGSTATTYAYRARRCERLARKMVPSGPTAGAALIAGRWMPQRTLGAGCTAPPGVKGGRGWVLGLRGYVPSQFASSGFGAAGTSVVQEMTVAVPPRIRTRNPAGSLSPHGSVRFRRIAV